VKRNFKATRPDEIYVADITYVPILSGGFVYLAVVLDCFTRMIVGWSIRSDLTDRLAIDALLMAKCVRGDLSGVVHHSDHGCQYTSIDFGRTLKESGILASMGAVGSCFDNAMAESFFATLECELIDRYRFANKTEAKAALFRYIEGFYNRRRRHSKLGNLSPANFEKRFREQDDAA
jgi:putative transposase